MRDLSVNMYVFETSRERNPEMSIELVIFPAKYANFDFSSQLRRTQSFKNSLALYELNLLFKFLKCLIYLNVKWSRVEVKYQMLKTSHKLVCLSEDFTLNPQ